MSEDHELRAATPQICDFAARPQSHRRDLFQSLLIMVVAAIAAIGCGDGRPARVLVSGQVLIDGKPLSHGYIKFVPSGARPSGGYLDKEGRFTLSCYAKNDGIIPGIHKVEVDAAEPIGPDRRLWHAPKKYASFNGSGLTQEITEATDSLIINLSWDGGKPFTERIR
jgi:hypothetical protein